MNHLTVTTSVVIFFTAALVVILFFMISDLLHKKSEIHEEQGGDGGLPEMILIITKEGIFLGDKPLYEGKVEDWVITPGELTIVTAGVTTKIPIKID